MPDDPHSRKTSAAAPKLNQWRMANCIAAFLHSSWTELGQPCPDKKKSALHIFDAKGIAPLDRLHAL
jgi:hypothetical protein